jgi:hypothetical protein
VKNNCLSRKIVINKSANVYISANVMPNTPPRDCGFSFAALSAANEKNKFLCALCGSAVNTILKLHQTMSKSLLPH